MEERIHLQSTTMRTDLRRWVYRVLILACLLAVLLLAGWYFWFRRAPGDGPVGIVVPRERFAGAWMQREVFLVGMGDSVTAGFGASPGLSYFERLARNPPGEFAELAGVSLSRVFPVLRVTNLAISGSTSLQHERSQLPKLAVQATNVFGLVVMTTGGNDLIHNYGGTPPIEGAMFGARWEDAQAWVVEFEKRLQRIVRKIEEAFPGGCRIFLANIYDPSDGTGELWPVFLPRWPDGLRLLDAYNRAIERVATERHPVVSVVDIHTPFLAACRT